MVICMSVVYWFVCNLVDERQTYLFLCFVLAAIASAALEGMTLQGDNLICSVAHFGFLVLLVNLFD